MSGAPPSPEADPFEWPAPVVPDSIVWADFDFDGDGELVLFNSEAGTYHALDRIAGFLWRRIAAGDDLAVIIPALRRSYDGDCAVIVSDVRSFIDRAVRLGLLVVGDRAR